MTDDDALTLCAFQEAAAEIDDGVAAIARVVLNRIRLKYASDGTVQGTVFKPAQFSWTQFAMVDGKYEKVAHDPEHVEARAQFLLLTAKRQVKPWARVTAIVRAVQAGTYRGIFYDRLTDDAVLYVNPEIVARQSWEIPANHICTIGHHVFYRDPPHSGPASHALAA